MKQVLSIIICLIAGFTTAMAGDHPEAHFGEYGLDYFPNAEGYKQYIGQVVEYLPKEKPSYDDKKFSEIFYGKFHTPYVIKKVSGNDKKIKFEMVEKNNPSAKIKFEFLNYPEYYSYGKNTFANTENYRVPLFFVEKFNEAALQSKGKQILAQNNTYLTVDSLIMQSIGNDYYPWICYSVTNPFTNKEMTIRVDNLGLYTDNIGKQFRNSDGSITLTIVDVSPFSFTLRSSLNNKDYLYTKENVSTPEEIVDYYFKAADRIGEIISDSECNFSYKIVGVRVDKRKYGTEYYYSLENSSTGKVEETKEDPQKYCESKFNNAKSGSYLATLSKVIKPSNSAIRYGKTKEIKDDDVTKFSYIDNVVDLIIFATSSKFAFELKNLSPNSIKIIWDEAVFVDADGSTSKIMHAGTRYSDRNSSQPATTIISNAKIEDVATPTDRVRYSSVLSEWVSDTMFPTSPHLKGKQLRLMIPIQIKNVINEYVFVFDLMYVPSHPELLTNPNW